MKINLLLPSRERPRGLDKVLNSIWGFSSKRWGRSDPKHEVRVKVLLDGEDKLNKSVSVCRKYNFVDYFINEDGIEGIGPLWNFLYSKIDKDAEIIGSCTDDIEFITQDWDIILVDEVNRYNDGIIMIGVDDGYFASQTSLYFVTKKACEILGYFTWREVMVDWTTTWMLDIFRKLDRYVYKPNIQIEFKHPLLHDLKFMDDTYEIAKQRRKEINWEEIFYSEEKCLERERDFQKLLDYIISQKGEIEYPEGEINIRIR